jgi:hypothetical protein
MTGPWPPEWRERLLAALPVGVERSLFRAGHDAGLPAGVLRRAVAELEAEGCIVVRPVGVRDLMLRRVPRASA